MTPVISAARWGLRRPGCAPRPGASGSSRKTSRTRIRLPRARAAIPIGARSRPSLRRSIALDAKVVTLGRIAPDRSDFRLKYEPANPAADQTGYVKYPNVNSLVEMTDMRDAQRSYEANLNVIGATRRMIQRTLDILKS